MILQRLAFYSIKLCYTYDVGLVGVMNRGVAFNRPITAFRRRKITGYFYGSHPVPRACPQPAVFVEKVQY